MFAKTFRNTLIASTLVVAGAMLANPVKADTVILGGEVESTSAVTSSPTPEATALNLHGEGTAQADVVVKVADMALITNNTEGFVLTALPYRVLIVANDATAPAAAAITDVEDDEDVTNFVAGAAARDLYIEYDAPALLDVGDYAATITVTLLDN